MRLAKKTTEIDTFWKEVEVTDGIFFNGNYSVGTLKEEY